MKKIPLTQGKSALVDDKDYKYLMQWKWHYRSNGYAVRKQYLGGGRGDENYKTIYMHREILNTSKDMHTDHINGNGLDNTRNNLRECSYTQNMQNKSKSRNKSSKYKGVGWDKRSRKWRSSITLNKKQIYICVSSSEIEAAKRYNYAAIKYFGEFAKLNEF